MEQLTFLDFQRLFEKLDQLLKKYKVDLENYNLEIPTLIERYLNAINRVSADPIKKGGELAKISDRLIELADIVSKEQKDGLFDTPTQKEFKLLSAELQNYSLDKDYVEDTDRAHRKLMDDSTNLIILYSNLLFVLQKVRRNLFENLALKIFSTAGIFLIFFLLERGLNALFNLHDNIVISLMISALLTFPISLLVNKYLIKPLLVRQINQSLEIITIPIEPRSPECSTS